MSITGIISFSVHQKLVLSFAFQVKGWELLIAQSDTRDSGYYQCRAENEAGMAQGTIHLHITPSGTVPSGP